MSAPTDLELQRLAVFIAGQCIVTLREAAGLTPEQQQATLAGIINGALEVVRDRTASAGAS